jgi:endoglucanase
MLRNKIGKKLTAGITALAMVASASAASISTLTAFAGEQLGEGTFNDGVGLPWHICENGTGEMAFSISDGVYSIVIKNPGGKTNQGEDRWDCQFRHRGLTLTYGNTYRLTFSVYSTNAGKLYAKIGDITNDDCEYWHGNGTKLSMSYKAGATMSEVESLLKSASSTGTTIPYYSWDGWCETSAKTWTTFAYEFQLNKSDINNTTPPSVIDGTAEWTFHFGGDGEYTPSICYPAGTILKFDNLALIDMTSDTNDYVAEEETEKSTILLNQVGYYPNLNKVATLQVSEGDSTAKSFTVYDSKGKAVYTGKSSGYAYDDGSWGYTQQLDFSDLTTTGEGYYIECDGNKSTTFDIGDDIYDGMLTDAINYYYLNRSGIEIKTDYIANAGKNADKSALARAAGHEKDIAYIADEWVYIYASEPTYTDSIDVSGGWYDAGDYGKYVVNGGVSMWTLANIYERDAVNDTAEKWADGSGTVVIPESGDKYGTPDILDELMWEGDFFLKMQRDDGMVYHKIHDYKWTALGVYPYAEAGATEKELATTFPKRIVKPVTYAATLNAAAALSQLSRLVADYRPDKASEYQAAAEKAYAAAKKAFVANYGDIYAETDGDYTKDSMFAPLDQNKGGGPYGDTQVSDEFYWAACELYITTGNSEYYTDLKAYDEAFEVPTALFGGENNGSATSFTWGTLATLGTASLALHEDLLTTTEANKINEQFQAAADYYLELEDASGYGIAYKGLTYSTTITDINGDSYEEKTIELTNGYEWGSNSMVVNNAIIMAIAYDITGDVDYINGVSTAFDYILGRNPMDISYVTGYGDKTAENPHHRYWCKQLKSDWPSAPNGCLVGGPNSDMNDPMIQGAGYKKGELAPMLCYYDQVEAWSVNEITINWNAPLVWLSSFLDDEAPLVGETTETDVLYGDVNCDGTVSILDVIALNRNLLGNSDITAQGKINADVDLDGTPTSADALNIMRYVVHLIEKLPV